MLYLVTGKEEFLREEFVGQLKTLMRKLPLGEHNIDELGPTAPVQDVIAHCDVTPFLCEKRMVIARGVLSEAGRRRPRRRPPRGRTAAGPAELEGPVAELAAYVPHLPQPTHLVLVEEDAGLLDPIAAARPDAVKRDFARLRDDALPGWISKRASVHAGSVSPRGARELAELVGSDLRALDNEIAKLATYVDADQTIEAEDVRGLVAGAAPVIFTFQDAVAERRPAAAMAAARGLMGRGTDPVELLFQMGSLMRRLLVVKELTAQRRALTRDAPAFGLSSNSYALEKLQHQAASLSLRDLESAYLLLRDTDLAVKRGRLDPELAVELAISQLTGIASNAPVNGDQRP